MQSEVSHISPVQVEIKVQVPWERVKKALDQNFTRVGKTAKIRGFRPGKVPRGVIRKLFGESVKAEVTGTLIQEGLLAAFEQHEIPVVAQPEVAPPPIAEGEDYEFVAKVEVRPTIENVTLEGLEVVKIDNEVPDEQVDAEVMRLRKQHADVAEPDPMRPAKAGDRLTIDYEVEVDGKVDPTMGAEGRDVDLGDEDLNPDFEAGLMGVQPGETKDIEVSFPEDHHHPDLKGKTATFKITVHALREVTLPEEDDEFAKDVGEFETLLELRLDIRKHLQEMADRRAKSELRDKLIDAALKLNDVPVPPSMVKEQKQQMLMQMIQFAQMTGQQLGDFSEIDGRAEKRVKAGLLLGAIAKAENLEIDDDAIAAKLAEMAEQTGKHIAKLKVEYVGEKRQELASSMLEERIFDLLESKATFVDAPAEGAESEEE